MGSATVPEFDEGVPAKNEPPKEDSPKGGVPPQKTDAAPADIPMEVPRPRRRSKTQREIFAGDLAAVELRNRLALMRDGIPQPAESVSSIPRFAIFAKVTGAVLMAAAAAGVVGYLLGFKLSSNGAQLPPVASQLPGALAPSEGANPVTPDRGTERETVQIGAPDLPASDARRTGQDPAAVRELGPPVPKGPRTVLPPVVPTPGTIDASEIAARMKIGTELVANGDIAAARKMFERVAEAGEAAGAFALAETYDPVVLGSLRLRGAIMPDPALARSWYEKARDLGASAAPERIARLARSSQ
jgi:hypothetical protein